MPTSKRGRTGMNVQATLEKLSGLRLSGMERSYRALMETRHPQSLTADELIAHLVDAEWDDRQERKTTRLMKTAAFRARATFTEVDFAAGRSLDKNEFLRLSDCSWVTKGRTIIISGPTGAGKSFLAQALGTQACFLGHKTLYFNCGKLFPLLKAKRAEGGYPRQISRIARTAVLILDDFGLLALDTESRLSLLEIIEDRYDRAATIISTQIPVAKWFDIIGDPTLADAICDRLVPQALRINLTGKSMRALKKAFPTPES
jgi:DNA replication protein DnaC